MPSIIINNANIDVFSFTVSFDIYNRNIILDTSNSSYNGSSGGGIFNIIGIGFSIVDGSGLTLSEVDFSQVIPSVDPVYTLDISSWGFPFLFQGYTIFGSIKDQDGTVYSTVPVFKIVCQPPNITESGYVDGIFQITPDCINNVLTVKELTLLTYNNTTPLSTTKEGNLYYPTGTISAVAFTSTPFSNNAIYTGQYRIVCTTVGTYDLGDGVYVLVTYLTNNAFDVTCSNQIADVVCCLTDTYNTYQKNCNNAIGQSALNKYNSAVPLLINGLVKQFAGIDASFEATEIKKLLNCNCGTTSLKQNEPTPTNPSVYSIVIQGACGTTVPSPSISGSTKTYTISSNVFQITKGDTGDLSYTITPDTSVNCSTKYKITFNKNIEAGYILDAIEDDASLLAQLNSLITLAGFNIDLSGLNGSCVIDLSATNYFLSLKVPSGAAVIKSVLIGSTTYTALGGLIVSNPDAIETWLNSLSLGTYSVSYTSSTSGNYINILSTSNAFNPKSAIFTVSGGDNVVPFGKTNKNIVAVLQAIIDYLCSLSALQIALGTNLSLCRFDYSGNIVSTSYTTTSLQSEFNSGTAEAICNIVQRINTLTGITCDKLKAVFIDRLSSNFLTSDRFYGTLGGNCAGITNQQAAMAVINAINSYTDVKTAFCAIDCDSAATCPDVANISIALSGATSVGVYSVTWTATPITTQTATVKYRINGTSTWTTATNSLQILPNGNLAGTSPYTISGLDADTTYDVQVINDCGGLGFIKQISTPSGTAISGSYVRGNVLYNICGGTPVTLYTSTNFGSGVVVYTDSGLTTLLTGYTLIAPDGGEIFNISTTTGLVGATTGLTCASGTAASYKLGNDTGTICATSLVTLYTSGAFAIGSVLFTDSALSNPQTGYIYVVAPNNHIYNLNTSSGLVGSDTGLSCSSDTVRITSSMAGVQLTAVNNISGFTPSPALPLSPGGTTTGTHLAFTNSIILTLTGTPIVNPSNITLSVNGVFVQCIPITAAGTYAFNSRAYLVGDVVEIYLNTGSCA